MNKNKNMHVSLLRICVYLISFAISILANAVNVITQVDIDYIEFTLYSDQTASVSEYMGPRYEEINIIIPETVTYKNDIYTVTVVEDFAFSKSPGMTSIELPNSLISIGDYAFSDCYGLTSIELPNSLISIGDNAFSCCSKLTSIKLPNSLISIGDDAFCYCRKLTSVTIPYSLESIGIGVFTQCPDIVEFICYAMEPPMCKSSIITDNDILKNARLYVFPSALGKYRDTAPWNQFDNIAPIPNWYYGCDGMQYIITDRKNKLCELIKCLELSETVWIPEKANLYVEPYTVKSIGPSVFENCSGLKCVIIPPSVDCVDKSAFTECTHLAKSAYPTEITNPFQYGKSISYIPNDVLIEDNNIYNLNKTKFIFAPIELDGYYKVPESITAIGKNALYACKKLSGIELPKSLETIGNEAFEECDNLVRIDCLAENPPVCDASSFPSTVFNNANLFVLPQSLDKYRATSPWNQFVNIAEFEGTVYEYGGLKYIVSDEHNGKCEVFVNPDITGRLIIPECIQIHNETYAVESIIAGAFKDCQGLKTVDFPANLKSIGADAFSGCDNILSITCRAIQPPSCEVSAFTNATYRNANLIVPYFRITSYKSTTGWDNFERYYNSSSLFQYDGLRYKILDSDAKTCEVALNIDVEGDIVIPSNAQYNDEYYTVTTIEKEAFIGAEINSVKFPESLLTIGENAFKDCGNLHEVVISENVTSIEGGAFNGCPIEVLNFDAINCLTCGNQTNPVFENTIKYIIAVR